MWSAVALAFGLAMDATAVSAARGLSRSRPSDVLVLPLVFGGFQAVMAAGGWLVGRWGGPYIVAWDHWIAFGLLVLIGGKMLVDGWRGGDRSNQRNGVLVYLALGVATSIDAAAAGLTLPLIPVAPWITITLIGGITAGCSAVGYLLGRVAGERFGPRLELVGGLVLIAIGTRLLVEHL